MKIEFITYRDKVQGCFVGKNIGGTLGAPLECKRGVFDYDFYSQDLGGEPLPNDDLDLQLLWLNVAEKYLRGTNASILGEYWQMYVTPNWSEYGAGKSNLRMGLVPPLSGFINNSNKNSCGAFIRSEIWACLAPGHPEIAVQYAYEDAIVDHSFEGVYSEVFFAALQSAAFVQSDKYKLIDIGLSYIPKDCAITKVVKLVMELYENKVDWKSVRKKILQEFPSTFGMLDGYEDRTPEDDVPFGDIGYDAPANVGITILGLLYGEDDFGKSICLAANCGEDADCTAATLGAIFGIIYGARGLPSKWTRPIGDAIKVESINLSDKDIVIPKTVTELTDRIIKLTPRFLGLETCDVFGGKGYIVNTCEKDDLVNKPVPINNFASFEFLDMVTRQPFVLKYESVLFSVLVDYFEEPFIREGEIKKFEFTFMSEMRMPQWLTIKWHVPESWSVSPSNQTSLPLEHYHGAIGESKVTFEITPIGLKQPKYDITAEISAQARHTKLFVPIILVVK